MTVVVVMLVAARALVVFVTGLPGPGPLRRYPVGQLESLSNRLNREDHATSAVPAAASVDLWRGRVRVSSAALSCNLVQLSAHDRPMVEVTGPFMHVLHTCPISR